MGGEPGLPHTCERNTLDVYTKFVYFDCVCRADSTLAFPTEASRDAQRRRHWIIGMMEVNMRKFTNVERIDRNRAKEVAMVIVLVQFGTLLGFPDRARGQLIAHWTFDVDGSDAVGAHAGTLQGGASISGNGDAIAGQALVLDGDGDYVSVPYSSDFELVSGTISLWFKGGPSSQQRAFYALTDFHHGSAHGPSHGWAILGGTGTSDDRIGLATGLPIVNFFGANSLLNSGVFHHFVATFKPGGDAILYVDGQQVATAALQNPFAYTDLNPPVTIGRWGAAEAEGGPANARDYLGRIDDVQIYNRPLNSGEVAFLFHNPGKSVPPGGIPTISQWGLIVMAGLVVAAGGSILRKRRARAA